MTGMRFSTALAGWPDSTLAENPMSQTSASPVNSLVSSLRNHDGMRCRLGCGRRRNGRC